MKYTIGIDVGTSGTKTVLFDSLGKKQASHTVEYPLYQPKNGWAEQDPADWKNAVFETVRTVMEKSGVDKNDVVGIGGKMRSCRGNTRSRRSGRQCGGGCGRRRCV